MQIMAKNNSLKKLLNPKTNNLKLHSSKPSLSLSFSVYFKPTKSSRVFYSVHQNGISKHTPVPRRQRATQTSSFRCCHNEL